MRTTFNISDALLNELKERARQQKKSLTGMVEETLQRGLSAPAKSAGKIAIQTFSLGVKPAYRGLSMNQLYDQLEAEDQLKEADS